MAPSSGREQVTETVATCQLKEKSLLILFVWSRICAHPEQACTALRAHFHREAFFSLDADFARRVTPQQPKLLCSSQLGETCPCPPDAVRRRERRSQRTGCKRR